LVRPEHIYQIVYSATTGLPTQADVSFDPEFPADTLDFPRIMAKNAINHIALNLGAAG
jgi:glycosyltransferase involved in cell wall biosynthesis